MNIDDAIRGHAGWKTSLTKFASGSSLDYSNPQSAAQTDHCALGRWLADEGQTALAAEPKLYQELTTTHADFHKQAGAIVSLVAAHENEKAIATLENPISDFNRASMKVISLLMVLKKKL